MCNEDKIDDLKKVFCVRNEGHSVNSLRSSGVRPEGKWVRNVILKICSIVLKLTYDKF